MSSVCVWVGIWDWGWVGEVLVLAGKFFYGVRLCMYVVFFFEHTAGAGYSIENWVSMLKVVNLFGLGLAVGRWTKVDVVNKLGFTTLSASAGQIFQVHAHRKLSLKIVQLGLPARGLGQFWRRTVVCSSSTFNLVNAHCVNPYERVQRLNIRTHSPHQCSGYSRSRVTHGWTLPRRAHENFLSPCVCV